MRFILLSYALLSVGMFMRSAWALVFVLAAFVVFCIGVWKKPDAREQFPVHLVTGILLGFIILSFFKQPLLHGHLWFTQLFRIGMIIALVGVASAWIPSRFLSPKMKRWIGIALIAWGLFLRILVPIASPHPRIDVYNAGQESAMHLLEGLNPYSTPISGAYLGSQDYGYTMMGYFYPPAALYLQTIGYAAFGDVRYACIVMEMIAMGVLWLLLRKSSPKIGMFLILLLLFHPRGLFVIDQAWTEPLLLGLFAAFLWFHHRNKSSLAAAVYGFFLSSKQSLVFFFFHWLLLERRWRMFLIAVIVGIATVAPFALWNMPKLWEYGVLFQLRTPFRPDALTIFAPLHAMFGLSPAKGFSIIVGAIFAIIAGLRFRRFPQPLGYLSAVTFTTFGMFLFGTQAFGNYYYFVCGLMVFLLSIMVGRVTRDHIFW